MSPHTDLEEAALAAFKSNKSRPHPRFGLHDSLLRQLALGRLGDQEEGHCDLALLGILVPVAVQLQEPARSAREGPCTEAEAGWGAKQRRGPKL